MLIIAICKKKFHSYSLAEPGIFQGLQNELTTYSPQPQSLWGSPLLASLQGGLPVSRVLAEDMRPMGQRQRGFLLTAIEEPESQHLCDIQAPAPTWWPKVGQVTPAGTVGGVVGEDRELREPESLIIDCRPARLCLGVRHTLIILVSKQASLCSGGRCSISWGCVLYKQPWEDHGAKADSAFLVRLAEMSEIYRGVSPNTS